MELFYSYHYIGAHDLARHSPHSFLPTGGLAEDTWNLWLGNQVSLQQPHILSARTLTSMHTINFGGEFPTSGQLNRFCEPEDLTIELLAMLWCS